MSHHVSIELFTRRERLKDALLALAEVSDRRVESDLAFTLPDGEVLHLPFEDVAQRLRLDWPLYKVPLALPLDDVLTEWAEYAHDVWLETDPWPEEAGYEAEGVLYAVVPFDLGVSVGDEYVYLSLSTISKFDNEILYASPSARAALLEVFQRGGGDVLMVFDGVGGFEDFEEGPPPRHNLHPEREESGDEHPWDLSVEDHRLWLLELRKRLRAGEGAPELPKRPKSEEPESPTELVPIRLLSEEDVESMRHLTGRVRPEHPAEELEWYATEDAAVLGLILRQENRKRYDARAYLTLPERLNIYLLSFTDAGHVELKTLKQAREKVQQLMTSLTGEFQPTDWFRPGNPGHERAVEEAAAANAKARAREG